MHLPTVKTRKRKGARLQTSSMKRISALYFIPYHFWLHVCICSKWSDWVTKWIFLSMPSLQHSVPFSVIYLVVSILKPQYYGCIFFLLFFFISPWIFPGLQMTFALNSNFIPHFSRACSITLKPECSVMALEGFLLHRQGDCGLHLFSKREISMVCFLYICSL